MRKVLLGCFAAVAALAVPSAANAGVVLTTGTTFNIPQYTFGIFGVIIVVTMLVRPQGLIPTARRKIELEAGVEGGSLYDAEA